MPTDKRARKRAARQARLAAVERQKRRRSALRRGVVIVVVAAVAGGIYALTRSSGKAHNATATTTTAPVPTSVPDSTTTTVSLAGDTTSANCPSPFTASTALKKPTFSSAPPTIIDPAKTYTATVRTDVGTFTIALDAKDSPVTVNDFVYLAENHFYDCVVFHRVIHGFVVQGGDPSGTGAGTNPSYTVQGEVPKSGSYPLYSVAMAKTSSAPNGTTGSQFYIVSGAQGTSLPPQYAFLGQVTSGTSVIQKIDADGAPANDPTGTGKPTVLHRMISVTISSA